MAEFDVACSLDTRPWITASVLSDFAVLCCDQPHISLLSDPDSLSLAHRVGRIGRSPSANSWSAPTCPWTAVTAAALIA